VLSLLLSVVTYQLSRWYLLNQRQSLATRQVVANALVATGLLSASDRDPLAVLQALSTARAVIRDGAEWYSAAVELNEVSLPAALVEEVAESGSGRQRVRLGDEAYVVVGVQLLDRRIDYYEFVSLREYERTLETLLLVLVGAASLTTALGAVGGWIASRRIIRPLRVVAAATRAMSEGELSRRLDVEHDPDLEDVAEAFNEMAANLEARIERELRFTSDVSHELRTPLTALASAVSLVGRTELDERGRIGLRILEDQVEHLRRLTLGLIEISRIDAGVTEVRIDDVDVEHVTRRVLADLGVDSDCLHVRLGSTSLHRLDQLRFERIVANLVENAERYAGGVVAVTLWREGGDLLLAVDDAGPGIEPSERIAIFGRFHRGTQEDTPERPKGSGLGLALVDEHVRLHGGTVGVSTGPWGGARFSVRIPNSP